MKVPWSASRLEHYRRA